MLLYTHISTHTSVNTENTVNFHSQPPKRHKLHMYVYLILTQSVSCETTISY